MHARHRAPAHCTAASNHLRAVALNSCSVLPAVCATAAAPDSAMALQPAPGSGRRAVSEGNQQLRQVATAQNGGGQIRLLQVAPTQSSALVDIGREFGELAYSASRVGLAGGAPTDSEMHIQVWPQHTHTHSPSGRFLRWLQQMPGQQPVPGSARCRCRRPRPRSAGCCPDRQ